MLALSPYFFFMAIDKVKKEIQGDMLWCIVFTDNIVFGRRKFEKN